MTIGTAGNRISFNCDGVTKIFPIPLQAYLAGDFTVMLTSPTGGETTLTLNSDYSLASSGTLAPTAWTLTTLPASAYATGNTLQAFVNPTQVQQTQYVQGQAFPSLAVQTNLDRLTQMVQRLQDQVNRSVIAPDGDVAPAMALPIAANRKNGTMIFDSNGNAAIGTVVAGTLSTAVLAPFLGLSQSAGEVAAGVVPTNFAYPPGHVWRYGADPTGVADATTAINNALLSNNRVYAPKGTYVASGTLNMISGQTFYGDGAATVLQFANSNLNNITMASLTSSTVRDMKIVVTGTTSVIKTGGVYLKLCTGCHVERMEMVGLTWSGVWLDNSNNCDIHHNYFHNFTTSVAGSTIIDQADITIYNQQSGIATSQWNNIHHNQCFSGGEHGVAIEDPYFATSTTGFPLHNTIAYNKVGPHTGYGILVYMPGSLGSPPGASDTYNQVLNNDVSGITGLVVGISANNSAGAGIYAVGSGIGAIEISGNTVFNCCSGTVTRSLAPAGIGVSGLATGLTPAAITNNTISGMSQGDGIDVTSSPGGALISGNTVNIPSSNNSTGPGGGQLLGACIRVEASSNVTLGPNNVINYGTGQALFVYANGVNSTDITGTGGQYVTNGIGTPVQTAQNGGFTVNRLTLSGVHAAAANAAPDVFSLAATIVGSLTGCTASAAGGNGLFINASTLMRVSGGSYTTSGAVAIRTAGVCTASFIDKSVYFGTVASLINNAGTGCRIEWASNAVPAAGTWAVGDHTVQTTFVVGNPKGWSCTVAGGPGTWVSDGNL
jgi:hypothetical protein